jgi:hypothetical protein
MSSLLQDPIAPISVTDARDGLSKALKAFRAGAVDAPPIFFGAQRKPEGVILSYAQYQLLVKAAALVENLGDIELLRDRLTQRAPLDAPDEFDEFAAELGVEDQLDD